MTDPQNPKADYYEALRNQGLSHGDAVAKVLAKYPAMPQPATADATRALSPEAARDAESIRKGANLSAVQGLAGSAAQGATSGVANDVLPGSFGQNVADFQQSNPGMAQAAELVGAVLGIPGRTGLGLVRAIQPAGMVAQMATGAGIGGLGSAAMAAGNEDTGDRLTAATKAFLPGAAVGGVVGAIPAIAGLGMKAGRALKEADKRTLFSGLRTAWRAMTGRAPTVEDINRLASKLGEGMSSAPAAAPPTPIPPTGAPGTTITPIQPKAPPKAPRSRISAGRFDYDAALREARQAGMPMKEAMATAKQAISDYNRFVFQLQRSGGEVPTFAEFRQAQKLLQQVQP